MSQELCLNDFRKMLDPSEYVDLTEDVLVFEGGLGRNAPVFSHPCRFDGYAVIYCRSGHFKIDVNLTSYDISKNSLIIYAPGNIVRVHSIDSADIAGPSRQDTLDTIIVALSRNIVGSLRIDFSKLLSESISLLKNPCISLKPQEGEILGNYYSLLRSIALSDVPNTREAVLSLAASACHLLGGIWSASIDEARKAKPVQSVRSRLVFENFLSLVTQFHTSERNVSFYADQLCLTPKYLSKLVKSVSGRSAPEWIDSYVILEAKNMLKYSDLSIKEIVYRLHFPDQSSFYKFFKSRTGMIPSEYRQIG